MFYLKEFLLIARDHKILTFANLVLLAGFACSLQFKKDIKNFFSMEAKSSSHRYFNALVGASANSDYIVRKMGNLPGVAKVEFKTSQVVEAEIEQFAKELGEEAAILAGQFKNFKINLEPGTRPESANLIKEYLSRLVGRQDVTFSEIKNPSQIKLKKNSLYSFFSKWSDWHIASLFATGWLFSLWLLSAAVCAQSFVIERFQRKRNAGLKIYLCICLCAAAASAGISLKFNRAADPLDLLILSTLMGVGALFFVNKRKSPQRFI